MFDSSTNYIIHIFWWMGLVTLIPGLITTYGEKYLPSILVQFIRYGRANTSNKKKNEKSWIIRVIEVPKNWFYHSYIYSVFLQSFIIYTVLSVYGSGSTSSWLKNVLMVAGGNARTETVNVTTTILVVSLYLIQVSRRLYETCFVCVYSDTKMNVVHYLMAWVHYTGSMLSLVAHSPIFASDSGISSDRKQSNFFAWNDLTWIHYFGTAFFFYGSFVQYQAHAGFASLRKDKNNKVVTMKHQIPKGGHFELISCPNYWGEIVVYSAFAIICSFRNYTWNYIALWVIFNQIFVGIMNHHWYIATFSSYPKSRKAVIPYIL